MIYYLALALSITIWGFNYIPIKYALETLHPYHLAFLTSSTAAITLWIFRGKKSLKTIRNIKNYKKLIGTGLFGTFGFNLFFNVGMKTTSPNNASLIIACLPVFGLLLGWLTHDERITISKLIGVTLSLFGVILLTLGFPWNWSHDFQVNSGDVLVLMAVLSLSIYVSIVKHLRTHYDPISITTFQLSLASLLFLPLALYHGLADVFPQMTPLLILCVLFVALIRSIVANNSFGFAVKHLPLVVATASSNFTPFVTVFFAWLLLDEPLLLIQIVSGVFIILGVMMTSGMVKKA